MNTPDLATRFADIGAALSDMGLLSDGEQFAISPLSGGVSCDVFLVAVKRRPPVVVKRALPKLRVEADWRAPVERSESEAAWIALAATTDARLVPRIIGQDRVRHVFAMEYLPKERYPVWKSLLAEGRTDPGFAGSVGTWLARLHAASAHAPAIERNFSNQAQFEALRLDPYLRHTARRHPDLAPAIVAAADDVAASRIALMHGDVSPKNILCGPETPVFLDAETACYGDPAFDAAFCLNHLLLKSVWHPEFASGYAKSFEALRDAYLSDAVWEAREGLERRILRLLSMLFLARIDGKSPVEYITEENRKALVRETALGFIRTPPRDLAAFLAAWTDKIRNSLGDAQR